MEVLPCRTTQLTGREDSLCRLYCKLNQSIPPGVNDFRGQGCPIKDTHLNPVSDEIEPGHLFDVDVDHLASPGPLVAPHRHWRMQVFQTAQAKGFEGAADNGERQGQQAENAPEGAALMAQGIGALQILWIERPPLAAAKTATIHQGGATTRAVTGQLLVEGLGVLNMWTHNRSRLTGVSRALGWVYMGYEVSGSEVTTGPWRSHTPCQLNNLLRLQI